jgi:hypothetical protein
MSDEFDWNCQPDKTEDETVTDIEEFEDESAEDEEAQKLHNECFSVSADPEVIATVPFGEEEKLGIPLPSLVPDPADEVPHLTSTVCDVCLELNLTHPAQIIRCERCEQAFCYHYASNIDARYCVNCMSDISVTKQVISKEYVHRDEQEHITSVYRRRAREVKIEGLSWLFAQRKIAELSDVELDMSIEYHRNILSLMIDEQERRRNAKMHRYAGVKTQYLNTTTGANVTNTTTTTVKKTRTVSKNKAEEQLNALIGAIAKSKGLDANAIAAILKGGK